MRRSRACALLVHLGLVAGLPGTSARADVASVEVGSGVFVEPSETSALTVLTPSAQVQVEASESVRIDLGYEADIVSGATESVKAGPLSEVDVVSSATSFSDLRHVGSLGARLRRGSTELGASYARGTEQDYRSQAFTVTAVTELLQKNTRLELSYARGFDRVCTSGFERTLAPSARLALDSSDGCFSDADDRATRGIDLDTVQAGWTQTWTPVLVTQLVFTGAVHHGFLANPYREVVIGATGERALEHHPENRARAALALRARYFVRGHDTALTLGLRAYRDTWDLLSSTVELEGERYVAPWLRWLVRGRWYRQTGTLFWSDDYTGGEPELGPRGQYWTGDRELSPLEGYLVGTRLLASFRAPQGERVLGALTQWSAGVSADALHTRLLEFTWGGRRPDDTLALIGGVSLAGAF